MNSTSIEGLVLNKENRAENFVTFTLFSPDLGLCYAMFKITKSKANYLPDFFNEVSLECTKGSFANYYFVKSINHIESINSFTKNYSAFLESSKLAECIIKNAAHLEDFSQIYKDLNLALKAYANTKYPEIINIKWLYKFAKREGYPIIEDFAQNLSLELQDFFVDIIKTPVSKCIDIDKNLLSLLYKNLAIWLNSQTEIIYNLS